MKHMTDLRLAKLLGPKAPAVCECGKRTTLDNINPFKCIHGRKK